MAAASVVDQLKALEEKQAQERRELIEKTRGPLIEKRDQLRADLAAVEKEIAALDASVGGGKKKASAKSPATKKSAKPQPTDDQILTVATKFVEDNPGISKGDLLGLTKGNLQEQGCDLRGFTMKRLDKQLTGNDRFDIKGDKVSLAAVSA